MKKRDLVSSIVWMALGGLFVVGALQHGLMRKGVPGPGFLPFLSGLALISVSLFVLIPALRHGNDNQGSAFFPERGSFRKIMFALAALFGYGIALGYLGYLLTTFLFMLSMGRLMESKGWMATTLLALLTAVLSYLLFVVLMEVQLPQGPLGF
ncbi:MAG: tripartite tricarboxylate transporter TctB family protein [Syntrophales bacterium]